MFRWDEYLHLTVSSDQYLSLHDLFSYARFGSIFFNFMQMIKNFDPKENWLSDNNFSDMLLFAVLGNPADDAMMLCFIAN